MKTQDPPVYTPPKPKKKKTAAREPLPIIPKKPTIPLPAKEEPKLPEKEKSPEKK